MTTKRNSRTYGQSSVEMVGLASPHTQAACEKGSEDMLRQQASDEGDINDPLIIIQRAKRLMKKGVDADTGLVSVARLITTHVHSSSHVFSTQRCLGVE